MRNCLSLFLVLFLGTLVSCGSGEKKKKAIAQLHLRMGTAYLVKGRYPQALRELLAAEENDPSSPLIQNNLGITYFTFQKNKLAIRHLKKAVALKKGYSDARNNLGRVYIEVGSYKKAVNELERVVNDLTYTSPNKALVNLGLAHFNLGQLGKAGKIFLKVIRVDRSNCLAYNYYGRTLFKQKRINEASMSLDQAVSLCKELNFDEPHYYSALAYFKLGQKKKAMARFNEVIELYPEGKYAKKSRAIVKAMDKSMSRRYQ